MSTETIGFDVKRMQSIFDDIHLCGCGSGVRWPIIQLILERSEKRESFYDPAEDASARWVEFGAQVLDGFGLLEHGTGIGWAWLTDEGEELLAWLRQYGTDDETWPEWWSHCPDCPCCK